MEYLVSEIARAHTANHFDEKNSIGSCFRVDLLPDLDTLIAFLKKYQPDKQVKGSDDRISDIYHCIDFESIGWYGVGLRENYKNLKIRYSVRNGFKTEFLEIDQLPKTNYITVVYKVENNEKKMITVFPGPYAPAFPHKKMTTEEYAHATQFWKDHILLRKI